MPSRTVWVEAPLQRILLLNYEYPPLGGGAGYASEALVERLVDGGIAVDVVTASTGGEHTVRVEEPRAGLSMYWVRTRRKGIHQVGLNGASGYLLHAAPVVRRLARAHRYDAAHFFFSLPTGALLPFVKLGPTPVIVSLRGSDVPGYDMSKPALQRAHRALRPLTRWIWRRADRVVTVCAALGDLVRRTDPRLDYEVIRNGVDLDLFDVPRAPRPHPLEPVRCLAVARLIQRKGIQPLLQAWALLERGRFRLEIAGDGPLSGYYQRLAEELGIASEVDFLGPLARDSLAERYRAADLFTLVPFDEAFGNVYAEALAAGLPIVGSDVGGIPELVDDGANGLLVPAGDPAATAAAIRRLADDPALRRKMSAANRARAEATLSWDHMAQQYVELYRRLAARIPAERAGRQPGR
jgi:glycosyltransferase involved in cell wall biosynthesis